MNKNVTVPDGNSPTTTPRLDRTRHVSKPGKPDHRHLHWHYLVELKTVALLTQQRSSQRDWLGVYVDIAAFTADRGAFNEFFYYGISEDDVPRNWLRWAMGVMQLKYRLAESNALDEQHSSYLYDCDLFLTLDKRLSLALTEALHHAPGAPGKLAWVEIPDPIVTGVVECIALLRARRDTSDF